jgi:hypothetical protein
VECSVDINALGCRQEEESISQGIILEITGNMPVNQYWMRFDEKVSQINLYNVLFGSNCQ